MEWLEEGGTKDKQHPHFDYVELTPYKAAVIIPVTDELVADSVINFVNYVAGLINRQWFYFLDNIFINGVGGFQPIGVIPDPLTIHQLRIEGGDVHRADLENMDQNLNAVFNQPVWLMGKDVGAALREELTAGNVPLYMDGWSMGIGASFYPQQINGYPVVIQTFTPAIGFTGDVALADFRYYYVAMRQDLTQAQSEHFYFDTDEQALRFVGRVDGEEAIHEAFVILDASTQGI